MALTPELAIPPRELRALVGPTDAASFDNPDGSLVIPGLPVEQFDSVLDFGCGFGRIARQLIQQEPQPRRYLGIDLHRGMIEWCRRKLQQAAPPGFEFLHHDVFELAFNPGEDKPHWLPFPAGESEFSLVVAWSVFTHVREDQARRYLAEVARVLRPGGVCASTWFLFDKREFPMMQEEQNALFINDVNPTNAVIFDREWLVAVCRAAGLKIVAAEGPTIRGFQWKIFLVPIGSHRVEIALPLDTAPYGLNRPPTAPRDAHDLGLED